MQVDADGHLNVACGTLGVAQRRTDPGVLEASSVDGSVKRRTEPGELKADASRDDDNRLSTTTAVVVSIAGTAAKLF